MDDEETEISRILGKLGLMQPAGGILGGQYPPPAPASAPQSPPFAPIWSGVQDAPGGNSAIDLARTLQAIDNHAATLMALNGAGGAAGASPATSDSATDQGSAPMPGNAMALAAARERPTPPRRPLPWPGFTPHFPDFASPNIQPPWPPNSGVPSGNALVNDRSSAQKDLEPSALIPNIVSVPSRTLPQINLPYLRKNNIDPDDLVRRIVRAENSKQDPNAVSASSSATGLTQFLEGTWADMIKSHLPDLFAWYSSDPKGLQKLRSDPQLSRWAAGIYANENAKFLERHNFPVTPGTLYLAHHFGAGGARKILTADPDALAGDLLPDEAKHNSEIITPTTTIRDLIEDIERRIQYGPGRR